MRSEFAICSIHGITVSSVIPSGDGSSCLGTSVIRICASMLGMMRRDIPLLCTVHERCYVMCSFSEEQFFVVTSLSEDSASIADVIMKLYRIAHILNKLFKEKLKELAKMISASVQSRLNSSTFHNTTGAADLNEEQHIFEDIFSSFEEHFMRPSVNVSDLPTFVCVPFLVEANRYIERLLTDNIEPGEILSRENELFGCCYWLKELKNTQKPSEISQKLSLRVDLSLNSFPHKLSNATAVVLLMQKLFPYLNQSYNSSTPVLAISLRNDGTLKEPIINDLEEKCVVISPLVQIDRMTAVIAEIPVKFIKFADVNREDRLNDLLPTDYHYGVLQSPLADAWTSLLKRFEFLYPAEVLAAPASESSLDTSSEASGTKVIDVNRELNPIGETHLSEHDHDENFLVGVYNSLLNFKAPLPGEPGAMKPSRPDIPRSISSVGGRPVISKPRG